MSKATEDALSELHGTVARVLNAQVGETVTIDQDGEQKEVLLADPAVLNAAIKFLKDNDITCDPEDNDNVNALQEKLKKNAASRGHLRTVGEE